MGRLNGWKPDVPDQRDHRYRVTMGDGEESYVAQKFPCLARKKYPAAVDLRSKAWTPVRDQGNLGSCVEHAWGGAMGYVLLLEGAPLTRANLSPMFLYYEVRGGVPQDTGSSIRDGIKTMARVGDCLESVWPYDLSRWTEKPSSSAYQDAVVRRAVKYARLSSLNDMLDCLSKGFPFVFGMTVYESFEQDIDASNDVCPMPKPSEEVLGGHALCAVGYDQGRKLFLIRNSWGTGWGNRGFFWLPFDYATNRSLSDDFWTVRMVPAS